MKAVSRKLAAGYVHPQYAESLSEFGRPTELTRSGGWLLSRRIPNSDASDAMGCYPLFFCVEWSNLWEDLARLENAVSVTVVTDPFSCIEPNDLRRCFPDLLRRFKAHYVVDLRRPAPSRHHRAKARKALQAVQVDVSLSPQSWLKEWERLYSNLRRRKHVTGVRAFSEEAFRTQLAIPGCIALRARLDGTSVSMSVWYVMGDVAYYHLGASDQDGYRLSASYALFDTAIGLFAKQGLRWASLGAGVGGDSSDEDGLARFKKGWSSGVRHSYLCGRIIDRAAYKRLVGNRPVGGADYFPPYRQGEFG